MSVYPKATCSGTEAARMANERADRWKARYDALALRLARVEAVADELERTPRPSSASDMVGAGVWSADRAAAKRLRAALLDAS